jgi:hypothetical protein
MIVTRKEALKQGLNRYNAGRQCRFGHSPERYTSNKTCVTCERIRHHGHLTDFKLRVTPPQIKLVERFIEFLDEVTFAEIKMLNDILLGFITERKIASMQPPIHPLTGKPIR